MSAAPIPPIEGTALQRTARELARQHGSLTRAKRGASFVDLKPVADTVDIAHEAWLATPPQEVSTKKAAEWLLDNEFLVRRALRQVTTEFPTGFQQHLPRLPDGTPRLLAVARTLTLETSLDLDAPTLRSFVSAYQDVSAFSIAELWALPAVMRACILETLQGFLAALLPGREPRTDGLDIEPSVGVERCVRALRLLEELDWKAFFARSSRVEATLRTDPTDVYGRMDFATRDVYRRIVEKIAWRTGSDENAVAGAAIALARDARLDPRRGHVGYWLVGDGRSELERRTGYRPSLLGRARRRILRHPALVYPGSLVLGVVAMLAALGAWLHAQQTGPASIAIWLFVASIPASSVATALVQRGLAAIIRPHALPKLDFTAGIPDDCRTVVAIPALLGSEKELAALARRLETHYLANPDAGLAFVLLTDDPDGKGNEKPTSLFDLAEKEIARLNELYGRDGVGPFHLVHRDAQWNPVERRFMGWERKRGKLDELNRMLRGQPTTSKVRHAGDPAGLERIRFVITLDADTQLPMGAAQRLVGLLAHPLNRAVFGDGGRVTAGYTIAQPRVETSPASCHSTWFARFFAGDTVFDVYTHAVSDTYQDLFGAGIYVGKGIYEVDSFMRSLEGCAPENWIASHDLFEGIHGRTALATDIVLYEDFPTSYIAYARRNHRWIRGDWQLLPWLWPRVPAAGGRRLPNRLRLEDRWKLADNLRRSLVAPALFVLLVACAFGRFGHPAATTGALVLAILAGPQLFATGARREILVRSTMRLALLPHDAWVAVDATARAFVRMVFTRRNLLQWTTAAHVEATDPAHERLAAWKEMAPGPIAAVLAIGSIAALVHPRSLIAIAPLAIAWVLAPELARWSRRPVERKPHESLRAKEVRELRLLARRTWHFFEAHVGPHDQFLPPDNVQHDPREQVAHRTSPTNIGLYLVSVLSAFDLGFIGILELPLLLKNTLDAIARLERYGGHLLNWYDTRTLEPLLPRYVSTVDSGNLAGCLLVLKQACLQAAEGPAWRRERWDGFRDVTELLRDATERLHLPRDSGRARVRELTDKALALVAQPPDAGQERECLQQLEAILNDLDGVLLGLIASLGQRLDVAALHELRVWLDAVHRHARDARRQMQTLSPWTELLAMPGAPAGEDLGGIGFGPVPRLADLPARCDAARGALGTLGAFSSPEQSEWLGRMRESLASAAEAARGLRDELLELAARADAEIERMDFRFLFDRERKLFHIGYDVTADRLDPNHYDLLASEARLASFLAIVKKDVPESHWYALGRPLRRVEGKPALLSWGGTMFEYLMPALFMRSHASTLLATSCEAAVDAQMAFATEHHVPWGVSECAYAHVDAHGSYQYRSFGVPVVALKRSLDDELITAPYASVLALRVRPDAVIQNLERLTKLDMLGLDGMYEAVDFQRRPDERPFAVVRTYMAHHQGMSLVAIANLLKDDVHVRRFHADPLVASGEILLDEGIAGGTAVESEIAAPHRLAPERAEEAALPTWAVAAEQGPSAWVLGNGQLSSMVTAACSGGLRWRDIDITRWEPDPAGETSGFGLHARDEENGRVWAVAPVSGGTVRVVFAAHKAELLS
ncbi:MAG TPA: glucoamylase family protein, partial [Polyangiaceae bacterium]|nr:glucoamylase family protein [Polyangiaceae bacterium]